MDLGRIELHDAVLGKMEISSGKISIRSRTLKVLFPKRGT